jgi:hypothetical protein
MSWARKISHMVTDAINKGTLIFILVSLIIFAGMFAIYSSQVSLGYFIKLNSDLPGKMMSVSDSHGISGFFASSFSQAFVAIIGLIIICLALSILSIASPGRYRYLLALPIFLSGMLFNFSILFLFFGLGFYLACLYVIPLGETYFQELKKWKSFRIGSNAVGKGLGVIFIFLFIGSYAALSTDNRYTDSFQEGLTASITSLTLSELENSAMQQDNSVSRENAIQDSMSQMRRDYPGLSEKQYSEMESALRKNLSSGSLNSDAQTDKAKKLVEASLKDSPIISSLLMWFPIFFSFTLWASLEFTRMFIFSPISGIFTFILFRLPFFNEKFGGSNSRVVAAIEYPIQNPPKSEPI